MMTAGAAGKPVPPVVGRNKPRSSAMSLAVLYRSDDRFESAFWQIRSSSLALGKVAPLDEPRDHEAQPVFGTPYVVYRNDVGMVQFGEDAGFVQVSLDILGLGDSFGAGNFDRNRAIKFLIKGQKDFTETALSQTSE